MCFFHTQLAQPPTPSSSSPYLFRLLFFWFVTMVKYCKAINFQKFIFLRLKKFIFVHIYFEYIFYGWWCCYFSFLSILFCVRASSGLLAFYFVWKWRDIGIYCFQLGPTEENWKKYRKRRHLFTIWMGIFCLLCAQSTGYIWLDGADAISLLMR